MPPLVVQPGAQLTIGPDPTNTIIITGYFVYPGEV